MSVQMSDDWSKDPHTDVTGDFNCDQEPPLSTVAWSVIRGNGGAAQLGTLGITRKASRHPWADSGHRKWSRSVGRQEDKRQSLAAVALVIVSS